MIAPRPLLAEVANRGRAAALQLVNQLNLIGSAVLAYALAYPGAFAELRDMLPEGMRPFAPALALGWFALVQIAKVRDAAAKKAKTDAS